MKPPSIVDVAIPRHHMMIRIMAMVSILSSLKMRGEPIGPPLQQSLDSIRSKRLLTFLHGDAVERCDPRMDSTARAGLSAWREGPIRETGPRAWRLAVSGNAR